MIEIDNAVTSCGIHANVAFAMAVIIPGLY